MSKPEPSELVSAAADFDQELAAYYRLGDLFLRAPLDTQKHLERANATLQELARCEERLGAVAQRLVSAIAGARERQQDLAQRVVDHAPKLQDRNVAAKAMLARLGSIAAEVAAINQNVSGPDLTDVPVIAERVLALATRSEELAGEAREADLSELAEQAHALHQRLLAIAKKLGAPE
ncbi:MAG TPA: hypothetical protein VGG74_14445 [Kofleriaceae bacterium]|jgi:hypothetical protein